MNDGFKETEIGLIPKRWDVETLKDISEDVSYGYTASATKDEIGPKFLRITDIVPSLINWREVPFCEISDKDKTKYKLKIGDIVIARTGANTGFNAIFKENLEAVFASYLIRFRMNLQKAYPLFVYYLLQSKLWDFHVQGVIGGSAQPGANAKRFGEFKLPLPHLNEQKAIAHVLYNLDNQIHLNHEMNRTLDALGQAIFRHWFVHFEFPNENGQQYKSNGGEMVDSELGEIPRGWQVKTTAETVDIVTDYVANGSFASLKENVTYKNEPDYAILIRLVDYNRNFKGDFVYVDEHAYNFLRKSKLFGGEIIISNVGANVGTVFKAPFLKKSTTLGPNAIMIRSEKFDNLLYYYFISSIGQYALKSITTGSAHPKFNKTDFRRLKIIVPPLKIINYFNHIISDLNQKITVNTHQNDNLSQIRDFLLPKLLSGKIRINASEEATAK